MYPSASGAPYHHHHLHHHQFQHATHNMLPYYSTAPPAAQQQQQQVLLAPPPSPPHAAPASYAPLQLVHSHFPSQHLLQPPQPHVATPSSSYYPSTLINTTPQLHPLMDNTTSNVVHFIPSSSSYTPPSASLYNSATVPSSSTALGVTSSSSSPHSNILPPPSPITFYVTPTYAPNSNPIPSSPPSMLVVAASQSEAPVTYNASNMTVYAARPPPPSAVGWGSDSTPSMFTTPSNTVPNFSLAYVDSSANASPADPALTVTPGGSATTPSTPVLEGVKGLTFSASKQKRSSKPIVLPLALPGNTQGCLQLVVHYLAPDITEAALQQLFEVTVPGCTHARIAIDPSTGRSRGFGYVWYSTQQDAIRAMEETNGRVLSRKRIRVLFASPQSEPW